MLSALGVNGDDSSSVIKFETAGHQPHLPYYVGESTDLGNTFWQEHFDKNKKTHLGRGLVKPSTEVL